MWFLLLVLCQFAQASGLAMYERAARLVGERYLFIDDFNAADALGEAAEAAEAAVPWLIVDVGDK